MSANQMLQPQNFGQYAMDYAQKLEQQQLQQQAEYESHQSQMMQQLAQQEMQQQMQKQAHVEQHGMQEQQMQQPVQESMHGQVFGQMNDQMDHMHGQADAQMHHQMPGEMSGGMQDQMPYMDDQDQTHLQHDMQEQMQRQMREQMQHEQMMQGQSHQMYDEEQMHGQEGRDYAETHEQMHTGQGMYSEEQAFGAEHYQPEGQAHEQEQFEDFSWAQDSEPAQSSDHATPADLTDHAQSPEEQLRQQEMWKQMQRQMQQQAEHDNAMGTESAQHWEGGKEMQANSAASDFSGASKTSQRDSQGPRGVTSSKPSKPGPAPPSAPPPMKLLQEARRQKMEMEEADDMQGVWADGGDGEWNQAAEGNSRRQSQWDLSGASTKGSSDAVVPPWERSSMNRGPSAGGSSWNGPGGGSSWAAGAAAARPLAGGPLGPSRSTAGQVQSQRSTGMSSGSAIPERACSRGSAGLLQRPGLVSSGSTVSERGCGRAGAERAGHGQSDQQWPDEDHKELDRPIRPLVLLLDRASPPYPAAATLIIQGLPAIATENNIRGLFGREWVTLGRITICKDAFGRCKGYSFADVADAEQCKAAVTKLDGLDADGCVLEVRIFRAYIPSLDQWNKARLLKGIGKGRSVKSSGYPVESDPPPPPKVSLFLGGLSFRVEVKDIWDLFRDHNILIDDVEIAKDKDTGKAKGFAFVTLSDANDAHLAVKRLKNTELCGRTVNVEMKGGAAAVGAGVPRPSTSELRADSTCRLYVGGLSPMCSNDILKREFMKIGDVHSAKMIMDRETGRSKGFGLVEFANPADVDRAIRRMQGATIGGRVIRLAQSFAPPAPGQPAPESSRVSSRTTADRRRSRSHGGRRRRGGGRRRRRSASSGS